MPNIIAQKPERRALSVEETAQTVGVSRALVYRLIKQGKLAARKFGGRRVVPIAAIDAFLSSPGETLDR
jgi:excisionase family DNA binding protein